jgi:Leucine-rich repeat (LRR) protein
MEITYRLFDNTAGKFTNIKDIYTLDENCKYLKIKFNVISALGGDKHNKKMIHLHLEPERPISKNRFTKISLPRNIFNKLIRLEILDLSKNKLSRLDPILFSNLTNLQELYLSENIIKKVDKSLFNYTPNLRILDCSNNELSLLNEDIFTNQTDLEILLLHNNKLTDLHEQLFDSCISKLQSLHIYENKLECLSNRLKNKLSIIPDFK